MTPPRNPPRTPAEARLRIVTPAPADRAWAETPRRALELHIAEVTPLPRAERFRRFLKRIGVRR
jgi:hypothetical protein